MSLATPALVEPDPDAANAGESSTPAAADTRPSLLTPVRVGRFVLRNRVAMAPMTRQRATADGLPVASLVALHYAQRASAGLLISEGVWISPQGRGYPFTPGIHSAAQTDAWRPVTDAVHARDGRIFLQLWHVGRISHPSLQPDAARPVAPSALAPAGMTPTADGGRAAYVIPQPLTTDEIQDIVRDYATAARHAIDAGFDGVELHGANGYLIDQFLRSGSNTRTDKYGGSPAHRARFLLQVTEAVATAVGADRLGVRLSPRGVYNSMSDANPVETFGHAAEALNPFGLAYLHVIEPKSGRDAENPSNALQPGPRVTTEIRARFTGPLIANGGYTRELADETLANGEADLVSFGSPFVANPDLVERFAASAPLQAVDRTTLYKGDGRGYTDYAEWDGGR